MKPVGFEPTISAGKWPQTHALDRAATGTVSEAGTKQIIFLPSVKYTSFSPRQAQGTTTKQARKLLSCQMEKDELVFLNNMGVMRPFINFI